MGKGSKISRRNATPSDSVDKLHPPLQAEKDGFQALIKPKNPAPLSMPTLPMTPGADKEASTQISQRILSSEFLSAHGENIRVTTVRDTPVIVVMAQKEGALDEAAVNNELNLKGLSLQTVQQREGRASNVNEFNVVNSKGETQNCRVVIITPQEQDSEIPKARWEKEIVEIGHGRRVIIEAHRVGGNTKNAQVATSPFVYVEGDWRDIKELFSIPTLVP